MVIEANKVVVFYDGACPRCIRDRKNYEKLAGSRADKVCWFDITGRETELMQLGISPRKALIELHIKTVDGRILSSLDAYIELMAPVPLLRPLAWILKISLIHTLLERLYHKQVLKRLKLAGRWPG